MAGGNQLLAGGKFMSRKVCSVTAALGVLFLVSVSGAESASGPGDSFNPTDLNRVKVGDRTPDFSLENMDGRVISLSEFRWKKNVVLVFYRGHW